MSKTLVAYFSASGVTARLANTLATAVGGDLYEIEPAKPYTSADLNWNNNKSRSSVEMNDPASRPAIAAPVADMEQYDTIFVGFPIWWYEAPRIVLQKSCPAARMVSGKRLSGSASASELSAWVKSLGL